MDMNDSHLKLSIIILEGFTTHKIPVKGTTKMQITLGDEEMLWTEEVNFYVVDIDSPYNLILGTPFMQPLISSFPHPINR